ncbi:peptidylprolyl isomerase, partial [Patescibacteria group bacterium]|nr:peptidylprolyl isomerase [Patescibacteria group bacterium]
GSKPDSAKTENGKKNGPLIAIIVAAIILIVVTPLVVFGVGLYKLNWEDKYTMQVAETLPYPAAIAGSQIVSFSEWKESIDTLKHFFDKQEEYGMITPDQRPLDEEIEKDELDRLIKKQILIKDAKSRGITVTQEEIDKKFDEEILPQAQNGIEDVETTLDDLYGWTVDDFKKFVIEEMIYREKLAEELNEELDTMTKASADEVLQKALSGEDFGQLAAQYGEDGTAATGGDLGTFEEGVMVPEFDEAVFKNAPVGEVYPELVKTQFGYHIMKVEEIIEPEGEDGVRQASAKHILISTNIDKYLDDQIEDIKIFKFVTE